MKFKKYSAKFNNKKNGHEKPESGSFSEMNLSRKHRTGLKRKLGGFISPDMVKNAYSL